MMQKTNLEERVADLQNQLKSYQQSIDEANDKIRYKTDLVFAKENEITLLNKKILQFDKQLEDKIREIDELQNSFDSRK
jgi:CRISPR-associated protein Cas8b1/Cst1 subtype I-B